MQSHCRRPAAWPARPAGRRLRGWHAVWCGHRVFAAPWSVLLADRVSAVAAQLEPPWRRVSARARHCADPGSWRFAPATPSPRSRSAHSPRRALAGWAFPARARNSPRGQFVARPAVRRHHRLPLTETRVALGNGVTVRAVRLTAVRAGVDPVGRQFCLLRRRVPKGVVDQSSRRALIGMAGCSLQGTARDAP